MAKLGRKTKFTPYNINNILKHLELGLYENDSIGLTNVGTTAWQRWKREDRILEWEPGENKRTLKQAIREAVLNSKAKHIKNIVNAGEKDWKASRWWLQVRYPQEFPVVSRIEYTGKLEVDSKVTVQAEQKIKTVPRENLRNALEVMHNGNGRRN
jgi:hypothetical protein